MLYVSSLPQVRDFAQQEAFRIDSSSLIPFIEKELLHIDLLNSFVPQMQNTSLVFQGGTALRLCYGAPRYSEDLDFSVGSDFYQAEKLNSLINENLIKQCNGEVSLKQPKDSIWNSLKKEFGPIRYALAYSDLREALENRGFEHRQGSGYLSKAPISKNKLIVLYDSLVEELPWLNTCSTAMHFADIGKTFNLKTLARNSSTSISDVEFFRNQGTQKRTSRASAESKTQSARATGKDNIIQFAPRQNGKDIGSVRPTLTYG